MTERPEIQVVEKAFAHDATFTLEEIAERAGLERDDVARARAAFGLPVPPGRDHDDSDLELAMRLRQLLDMGVELEQVIELNRVVGRAMAQVAAAARGMVLEAVARPEEGDEGDEGEDGVARRLAEVVPSIAPFMEPVLGWVFAQHVRQLVRSELVAGADVGAREVVVAFADLVGFTRLGEQVPPEDLGRIARRLESLADEHVRPPVVVVKTIGDALMLVAPDAAAMVGAALDLVAVEDPELPQLSVGIACGPALERAGDWYGRPVNLASRLSDLARPATVVATREVRDAAGEEDFSWSSLRPRKIKGVGESRLFRARRREERDD